MYISSLIKADGARNLAHPSNALVIYALVKEVLRIHNSVFVAVK